MKHLHYLTLPHSLGQFQVDGFFPVRFLVCCSLKNAYGVNPLKGLWGRCRLYCFLQASIFCWASWRVRNQCSLRHSSRNLPLKLSIRSLLDTLVFYCKVINMARSKPQKAEEFKAALLFLFRIITPPPVAS